MATNSVARQLDKILDDYIETVNETTDDCMSAVAKATVKELKQTSPRRQGGGAYARSWAVKNLTRQYKHLYIVHNRKHYQLTHLLEKGHVIKNQYGTYGRTNPERHIAPAEEHAQVKLIKELESKL